MLHKYPNKDQYSYRYDMPNDRYTQNDLSIRFFGNMTMDYHYNQLGMSKRVFRQELHDNVHLRHMDLDDTLDLLFIDHFIKIQNFGSTLI